MKDALQKYNVEAIQKFKDSKNLHESNLIYDVYEHAQENFPSSIHEEKIQECQEFNTDQVVEIWAYHLQFLFFNTSISWSVSFVL